MRGGIRPGAGRKPGTLNKERKTDARERVVHVRLSEIEYDETTRCAELSSETVSDFVRISIKQRCQEHCIS